MIIHEIQESDSAGINLNFKSIKEVNLSLYRGAMRCFGSWKEAVNQAGFNYDNIGLRKYKNKGFWTREVTIDYLISRFKQGLPMSLSIVNKECGGLLNASLRYFGTYENAIIECGFNYDEIREDVTFSAYFGSKFEILLRGIFKDLNIKYKKGFNKKIQPDFIFTNGIWADAKLSEWSLYHSSCQTIEKYEPFCDKLTIIYLRGDKNKSVKITEKTNIVSVYKFIDDLEVDKKEKYIKLLDELYIQVDKQEDDREDRIEYIKPTYKCVRWVKDCQKWITSITVNHKTVYLGLFKTEEEAAREYDRFVLENNLNRKLNFGINTNSILLGRSIYKGVIWRNSVEMWESIITISDKLISLGYFLLELEAAQAYDNYIIEKDLNRTLNKIHYPLNSKIS